MKTIVPIIQETVEEGSTVHTDEYNIYDTLASKGFGQQRIMHLLKIYVMGNVHTNTIEGFWAQIKNAVRGNCP